MAQTRAATGNSKPRIFEKVEEAAAPKKKTTKTKANTSKPRAKTVTTGRVEKKRAAPKTTTAKTGPKTKTVKKAPAKQAKDKVAGKVKKAEGAVEGKPAKKVRILLPFESESAAEARRC